MGNPRNWFRPDRQVERWQTKDVTSEQRQAMKTEHKRRQRAYNGKLIRDYLGDEE